MSRAAFAFAAWVAIALLVATKGAAADSPTTGILSIQLLDLRNDHGRAGCLLFGSEKGFPTDPGAALQRTWCAIAGGKSTCRFEPIPAGTYAVACFHDENGNGKLDTGVFGIPKEGTVASNHAKGFMGAPKFHAAKFSLSGADAELSLRMGY